MVQLMKRTIGLFSLLVFTFGSIAACTSTATQDVASGNPPIILTPLPVRIQLPIALEPFSDYVYRCQDLHPELSLYLNYASSYEQDSDDMDTTLWWGEPPAGSTAYPLAEEGIHFIWNSDNAVERVTIESLREIFAGSIRTWDAIGGDQEPIQTWSYSTNALSHLFLLNDAKYGINPSFSQWIAPDPRTMLEAVREDVYAIGYVPSAWLDESVNALAIDITLPIVALTSGEAQESTSILISCLQDDLIQGLIAQKYPPER